jgi:hypothetical protein
MITKGSLSRDANASRDLSKEGKSFTAWLEKNYQKLMKMSKDVESIVAWIEKDAKKLSLSDKKKNQYIDTLRKQRGVAGVQTYLTNAYMKGKGLGVREMKENTKEVTTLRAQVRRHLLESVWDPKMFVNEELSGYQEFFKKALAKFNVDSPDKLADDKKKEFFNYVDKNWTAKDESINEAKSFKIVKLVDGKIKGELNGTVDQLRLTHAKAIDNLGGKDPKTIDELLKALNKAQQKKEKNSGKTVFKLKSKMNEAAPKIKAKKVAKGKTVVLKNTDFKPAQWKKILDKLNITSNPKISPVYSVTMHLKDAEYSGGGRQENPLESKRSRGKILTEAFKSKKLTSLFQKLDNSGGWKSSDKKWLFTLVGTWGDDLKLSEIPDDAITYQVSSNFKPKANGSITF